MRRNKKTQLVKISWIVLGISLLYITWTKKEFFFGVPHDMYKSNDVSRACVLPHHNPYDSSIANFFYDIDMPCDTYPEIVSIDSNDQIVINQSAVKEAGWNSPLTCEREYIQRIDENNIVFRKDILRESPSECSQISCRNENNVVVYRNIKFHVNSERVLKSKLVRTESPDNLNLLIFGVDSMSQLTARRHLPHTLRYLERTLGGHIMNGYTKVAENTFPNMITLFSGKVEQSEAIYKDRYLDDMVPFIWKNFSEKGYVTMYTEDYPQEPNFNDVSMGFQQSPTDHYFRPCTHAFDYLKSFIKSPKYDYSTPLYNKVMNTKKYHHCQGDKPRFVGIIDYFKLFLSAYRRKRKFALSWISTLAHRDPNYLMHADDKLKEFFEWTNTSGHLNNSVLLFLSDHGSNINAIRNTAIGRIGERMPLFVIVLPPHLKQKYPHLDENLRKNKEKLTTHFDAFQTTVDILSGSFEKSQISKRSSQGVSLFSDIPEGRSCRDASVSNLYCPCYKYVPVDTSSDKIQEMGKRIVQEININVHQKHPICLPLTMNNVKKCDKIESNFIPTEGKKSFSHYYHIRESSHLTNQQYRVLVSTMPNHALFEGIVAVSDGGSLNIEGVISRANLYHNQSRCVDASELKRFCFCG